MDQSQGPPRSTPQNYLKSMIRVTSKTMRPNNAQSDPEEMHADGSAHQRSATQSPICQLTVVFELSPHGLQLSTGPS